MRGGATQAHNRNVGQALELDAGVDELRSSEHDRTHRTRLCVQEVQPCCVWVPLACVGQQAGR